jgi:hypothetical protein
MVEVAAFLSVGVVPCIGADVASYGVGTWARRLIDA